MCFMHSGPFTKLYFWQRALATIVRPSTCRRRAQNFRNPAIPTQSSEFDKTNCTRRAMIRCVRCAVRNLILPHNYAVAILKIHFFGRFWSTISSTLFDRFFKPDLGLKWIVLQHTTNKKQNIKIQRILRKNEWLGKQLFSRAELY